MIFEKNLRNKRFFTFFLFKEVFTKQKTIYFAVGDLISYTLTGDKEADIKAVTQMYTTALEKLIGEQPDQWLWAHRRWLNINRKGYIPEEEILNQK